MKLDINVNVTHSAAPGTVALLTRILKEILNMSEATNQLDAAVNRVEGVVTNVVVQLREIKDALDAAVSAGDLAAVQAATAKLNLITDALVAGATATDISPDTPVEGGGSSPSPDPDA